MLIQLAAAFVGTAAFAVLFGVPRRNYLDCGFCGMVGWLLYLVLARHTGLPGAGIFWTTYHIVSNQVGMALQTGFVALKATVAIAFGILAVIELNGKNRIGKMLTKRGK